MALAFYAHLSRVATGVAMCCAKSGKNVERCQDYSNIVIVGNISLMPR